MPYANNNGVRIHYHVEGQGDPMVLQHGFMGRLEDWYNFDYVEPLKKDYQLILIDARGHGKSDKLYDPESYKLELRARDVVAVLDDLNINKAHYFGYSMGGWIGYGIARYAPERFYSLIIGGAQPYAQSFEAFRAGLSKGMNAFVASIEDQFGSLNPDWKVQLLENDVRALIACQQDRPDIDDMLPGVTTPCLLYAGDVDPIHEGVKKSASHIPNAIFLGLPGLDHLQGSARSDLVLPQVREFLAEVGLSERVS